jgi:hypothetical protein
MTSIASTAAADYANAVRAALADLPHDQVHAIVDGLDEHLAEITADGTTELAESLGPPEAYAAELRAAAGLPPVSPATGRDPLTAPPAESARVADHIEPPPLDPDANGGQERWVPATRIALGAVAALLAIVVIRVSDPLNGVEVVAGAAIIGAAWWTLRWASTRARLPESWAARVPLALGAAAIVGAVLLGGELAGSQRDVVYIDNPEATVAPELGGLAIVPDVIGRSGPEAQEILAQFGLESAVVGDRSALETVLWSDPAPGAAISLGSLVRLGVGDVASPTSIFSTMPEAVDATPSTTTFVTLAPSPASATTTTIAPDTTVARAVADAAVTTTLNALADTTDPSTAATPSDTSSP